MSTAAAPAPVRWLLAPLHWLERARGRRRKLLIVAYLIVLAALCAFGWRSLSLRHLPDVGDPFDVAAAGTVELADGDNAFVVYKQAAARLSARPLGNWPKGDDWSKATPELRDWVRANGPALELFLAGSRRPDALLIQPREMSDRYDSRPLMDLRELAHLALLEASRREHEGDPDAAAELYGALLRAGRYAGRHLGFWPRLVGGEIQDEALPHVVAWSEDPKVGRDSLRRVLDDAGAAVGLIEPTSAMLKADYLAFRNNLAHINDWIGQDIRSDAEWVDQLPGSIPAQLFLKREPERSLRIARLAYANWLAYADRPRTSTRLAGTRLFLFQPDASAPPAVRAIAPERLDAWCESSMIARRRLDGNETRNLRFAREDNQLRLLRVTLAEYLYRRDHDDAAPANLGQLVGPYLDRLPDGFAPDDPPVTVELQATPEARP